MCSGSALIVLLCDIMLDCSMEPVNSTAGKVTNQKGCSYNFDISTADAKEIIRKLYSKRNWQRNKLGLVRSRDFKKAIIPYFKRKTIPHWINDRRLFTEMIDTLKQIDRFRKVISST